MNVDQASRLRYAEVLRHFAAGRLNNDEYEDATNEPLASHDPSLFAIWRAVWMYYDDIISHRLSGEHALSSESRRGFARVIVFLHSDLPYEWPTLSRRRRWLALLTLGISERLFPLPRTGGDESVWPFFRRSDLEAAASRPRLLAGARNSSPQESPSTSAACG